MFLYLDGYLKLCYIYNDKYGSLKGAKLNNKVFIAKIAWLRPSQGGRNLPVPFKNDKYCPVVSINGEKYFEGVTFSTICYSFKKLNKFKTLAYIRYLNTESAPDNLAIGAKLELFEGNKLVALGEVVQKTDFKFESK